MYPNIVPEGRKVALDRWSSLKWIIVVYLFTVILFVARNPMTGVLPYMMDSRKKLNSGCSWV